MYTKMALLILLPCIMYTGCTHRLADLATLAQDRLEGTETTTTTTTTTTQPAPADQRVYHFGQAIPAGYVQWDTHGIVHQTERNRDGGWEYMIATLHGESFERVVLMTAGGNRGRAVRLKVNNQGMQHEIASDNLPDWHTWRFEWGGGQIKLYLDGKQIGKTEPFNGAVNRIIMGNDDKRRDFKGTWRNVQWADK